jgi:hypothetical protein
MSAAIAIYDETTGGERTHSLTLEFPTVRVTARELIRRRVYEEVQEYNLSTPECFRGLVQPTEAERVLNGYRLREHRKLDWEQQYERALEAFQRNGFIMLVDNRQVEDLDDEIDLTLASEVSFLKLLPLVGG